MPLYKYQALTKDGKKVTGTFDAPGLTTVREMLGQKGMYPVSIELVRTESGLKNFFATFFKKRVDTKGLVFFTKQLSVLLKAGIPILHALELLVDQTEGQLQRIVIELKDLVKEGTSLADGLARYPKIFSTTYIQLVRAGEASGKLETVLERLTASIERGDQLSRKIRGAMVMPLIQLSIACAVVVAMILVVVPKISESFSSMKLTLPLPTRILINLSYFLVNYYLFIIIGLVIIIGSFIWWKSTPAGSLLWDKFILKVPIIGYFARMNAVVQFSRTLGMLLEAGVNLSQALQIVTSIVKSRVLTDKLSQARDNIIKQGKIAQYLKDTNMFPAVAIYLMKTGEESGTLDQMLLQIAQFYDTEVSEYADGLVEKLSPAMTVIMGAVVGFIVMAIASPMMKMNEGLMDQQNAVLK